LPAYTFTVPVFVLSRSASRLPVAGDDEGNASPSRSLPVIVIAFAVLKVVAILWLFATGGRWSR